MNGNEHIATLINNLPPAYRSEALDFIEFLTKKARSGNFEEMSDVEWSEFSLRNAVGLVEPDDDPVEYSEADLKVKWR
jgi:hypothetical protein